MSKALACTLALWGLAPLLMVNAQPKAREPQDASTSVGLNVDVSEFDQSCLDAMKLVQDSYYDSIVKPLSPLAMALVRKCNGHPGKAICEAASQVVLDTFKTTPFTCGSNTADSVPLLLPKETPTLRQPR